MADRDDPWDQAGKVRINGLEAVDVVVLLALGDNAGPAYEVVTAGAAVRASLEDAGISEEDEAESLDILEGRGLVVRQHRMPTGLLRLTATGQTNYVKARGLSLRASERSIAGYLVNGAEEGLDVSAVARACVVPWNLALLVLRRLNVAGEVVLDDPLARGGTLDGGGAEPTVVRVLPSLRDLAR